MIANQPNYLLNRPENRFDENRLKFSLFSLVESVARAALGCIGLLGYVVSLGYLENKEFSINQLRMSSAAASRSFRIFCSILKPLTAEMRENRIRSPEKIRDKLLKEKRLAAAQGRKDTRPDVQKQRVARRMDPPFEYQKAPRGYFSDLKEEDGGSPHIEDLTEYPAGICHCIGHSKKMEDAHLTDYFILRVGQREYPVNLFTMFDGHGGKDAAQYAKVYLTDALREALDEFCAQELTDANIWNAIKMAFVKLNRDFPNPETGTTVAMAMILNGKLWTANSGDSRIIVDREFKERDLLQNCLQLTEDAKPTDPRYQKAIHNRGGEIADGRIQGKEVAISVARAIGDHNVPGVTARPKIADYHLADMSEETLLILACDGIWDVASTEQIAEGIRRDTTSSLSEKAANGVYSAFKAGSQDNLSLMVVSLKKNPI